MILDQEHCISLNGFTENQPIQLVQDQFARPSSNVKSTSVSSLFIDTCFSVHFWTDAEYGGSSECCLGAPLSHAAPLGPGRSVGTPPNFSCSGAPLSLTPPRLGPAALPGRHLISPARVRPSLSRRPARARPLCRDVTSFLLLGCVGGEQMATRECGTGKAEIMKNLKTKGVS